MAAADAKRLADVGRRTHREASYAIIESAVLHEMIQIAGWSCETYALASRAFEMTLHTRDAGPSRDAISSER